MNAFVSAGAGFLLAVLWFDLMFDVQVLRHRGERLPDEALTSIAGYYRRVTTDARPMNRLIGAVMAATIAALVVEIAGDDAPAWAAWTSLGLLAVAVGVAALHTVPAAVRVGGRQDPPSDQERLARSILRDHLLCLGAISTLLVLQLGFAG